MCGKDVATGKLCGECKVLAERSGAGSTPATPAASTPNARKRAWATGVAIFGFIVVGSLFRMIGNIVPSNATETTVAEESMQSVDAYLNAAYGYLVVGEYGAAMEQFQLALHTAEPESQQYHLVTGEIAELENDPARALAAYTAAYDVDPSNAQVNSTLALFYLDMADRWPEYSDYDKALYHATDAFIADPEDPTAVENLAYSSYFAEEYEDAVTYFLMTDLETDGWNNVWLGYAYLALGDTANAEYYFQQGSALGAQAPDEVTALGESRF